MNFEPKLHRRAVEELTGGDSRYHKTTECMAMEVESGKMSTNNKEHMNVFKPHLENLYNNNSPIYACSLANITERAYVLFG